MKDIHGSIGVERKKISLKFEILSVKMKVDSARPYYFLALLCIININTNNTKGERNEEKN